MIVNVTVPMRIDTDQLRDQQDRMAEFRAACTLQEDVDAFEGVLNILAEIADAIPGP